MLIYPILKRSSRQLVPFEAIFVESHHEVDDLWPLLLSPEPLETSKVIAELGSADVPAFGVTSNIVFLGYFSLREKTIIGSDLRPLV